MNAPVFLDSFAALLPEGMYGTRGFTPWKNGQTGPDDVSREQVLDKPYPGFGKLQLADRLAFAAAALLFSDYPHGPGDRNGIVLATPAGSFSTDMRYMESVAGGYPSPAIFSATLPSSAVADAAIFFGLKGPIRVLAADGSSGLCAFEQAALLLQNNKADAVVALSLHAVESAHRPLALLAQYTGGENGVYAFLLTRKKNPVGLGFRVETNFSIPEKTLPAALRESYFDDLTHLLMERKNGRVSFAGGDYCGHITIEKDL